VRKRLSEGGSTAGPSRDFPRHPRSVKDLLGKQMDALARRFAATHDMKVKVEIDRLSSELVKLDRRGCSWRGEEFRASDPFVYSSMVSFNV